MSNDPNNPGTAYFKSKNVGHAASDGDTGSPGLGQNISKEIAVLKGQSVSQNFVFNILGGPQPKKTSLF